jgi:putative FmdB family regulatory protein
MPVYVFICEACNHNLEVEQNIKKPTPNRKKCPTCKKNKLKMVLFAPHVYNKPGNDNISVGLLSDRNASSFSENQKRAIDEKHGIKRKEKDTKKNFWETSDTNLQQISEMTPAQKKKYIDTGKK